MNAITTYYYDSDDGRRAKLAVIDRPHIFRVRLIIRADHGQGALLLCKTYTTRKGARAALRRRGGTWTLYKKTTF